MRRGDLYTKIREPFFFDYVKQQLIDKFGVNTVRKGGLKVYTTIDPKLQKAGREAIDSTLHYPGDPSAAVVAIDPRNGYIRAMASSSNYRHNQYNLAAQGHRQPGSAFKTFVLTTAIKRGVNPNSTSYVSRPLDLNTKDYGPWKVQTYDQTYGGSMNLVRATLRSDNTVYAQLDLDLGPKSVADTAKEMGITTKLDGYPAEGLGGLTRGVSPLEMANAYATLASGGIRNKPIAITQVKFPDGEVEDLGKPKRERVFSDAVAYEVTKILKQNVQQGTGTRANIGCPAAGKTGTTDNFNDAWFDGYTPHLAAAVWVGYPDALREMRSVHGISVAGGTFPARDLEQVHAGRQGQLLRRLPRSRRARSPGPRSSASTPASGRSLLVRPGAATATPTAAATRATTRASTVAGRRHSIRWRNRRRRHRRSGGNANGGNGTGGASPLARPRARTAGRRARGARRCCSLVYVALAVPFAAPGSRVVLATDGGSPDWLLGPFQLARRGRSPTARAAGPLFYLGLWVATARLRGRAAHGARSIGPRLAVGAIVGLARPVPARAAAALAGRVQLHRLRAARRAARPQPVHAQPRRRARRRRSSRSPARRTATSVYGPLFTLAHAAAREARRAAARSGP